jgi:hypothetical protein
MPVKTRVFGAFLDSFAWILFDQFLNIGVRYFTGLRFTICFLIPCQSELLSEVAELFINERRLSLLVSLKKDPGRVYPIVILS